MNSSNIVLVQPIRKWDILDGKEKQLQNRTLDIIKLKYEEII